MSIVLAFDQASRCTGYAVFENNNLKSYNHFTLEESDTAMRLHHFRTKVKELIEEYNPNTVVFEDIQEQNNIQTFKTLACVYGIMLELLADLQIDYAIMPSVTWKSTLGIKGKKRTEQKKQAQEYVLTHYHAKATQDESDSICIGAAYLMKQQGAW